MKYRADIDGLRAISVIAVILFHLNHILPGGYVGVDVFFVISGYLVTVILSRKMLDGSFSLKQYFIRRVRRLFPVLAAVISVTMVGSWLVLTPDDLVGYGKSLIAQSALLANMYFYRDSGYFSAVAETKPLLHLWSLAVEEQFYLIYPVFLLGLFKLKQKWRALLLPLLLLLSLAACIVVLGIKPKAAFYLLPYRAWELCLGGMMYFIAQRKQFTRGTNEIMGLIGLLGVIIPMFLYSKTTSFPGLAALLPVVGASLCILSAVSQPTLVSRLLSVKPLVLIGLMSYSLYLWHWPLIVFNNYWGESSYVGDVMLCAIVLLLSVCSWTFIEKPLREKKILSSTRSLLLFFVLANIVFVGAGFLFIKKKGFSSRFDEQVVRYLKAEKDRVGKGEFDTSLLSAEKGEFKQLAAGDSQQPLLVLGDSHARSLVPMLREVKADIFLASISSTPPILGFSEEGDFYFRAALKFIKKKHIKRIVLVSKWSWSLENQENFARLQLTIERLRQAKLEVFVIGQAPIHNFEVPRFLASSAFTSRQVTSIEASEAPLYQSYARIQHQLQQQLESQSVVFVDLRPLFIIDGRLKIAHKGEALYYDSHHLSGAGARYLRQKFSKEILFK